MDSWTDTAKLAVTEMVIMIILFAASVFISIKHSKIGMLTWPTLASFCILRIIADILHITKRNEPPQQYAGSNGFLITTAGSIACLVITLIGILYEAAYFIHSVSRKASKIVLGCLHVLMTASISTAMVGSTDLKSKSSTCPQRPSNPQLAKLGYAGLLFICVFLLGQAIFLLWRLQTVHDYRRRQIFVLVLTTLCALPFTAIRIVHSTAYVFDPSPGRDPNCGSFATTLVAVFLTQLSAAMILVIGGFLTRNIRKDKVEEPGDIPLVGIDRNSSNPQAEL